MQKIIITTQIGSIEIGNSAPFIMTRLEGTGPVEVETQTQKAPYQDGVTYIDSVLGTRKITMQIYIVGKDNSEVFEYRRILSSMLNPKITGTLRYIYENNEKEIGYVVDEPPEYPSGEDNTANGFQRATFTLFCPCPFWQDPELESEEMADWIGGLSFPLELPTMFSSRSTRLAKIIHNAGDVDTPITFEFLGAATNPEIINVDTGEYIKINRAIGDREKLVITTEFGNKKVELVNLDTGETVNAFSSIDLGSTFFQLRPGDNRLSYDADWGKENAKVWVRWKNRYIGV